MVAHEPTTSRSPVVGPSKLRLLQVLGPGLISGAANDDPTAIATYSQAGARFGFAFCWLVPFAYPLMASVKQVSAQIGCTTGHGLAGQEAAAATRGGCCRSASPCCWSPTSTPHGPCNGGY